MAAPALLIQSSPATVVYPEQRSAQAHVAFAASGSEFSERGDTAGAHERELLMAENFGPRTFKAVLRRRTDARRRLLLCVTGLSSCPGWLIGVALRSADVIVADGEEATRLLRKLSAAGPHVFASTKTERSDVAPFLKFQLDRTVDGTHRLAFSDDLAPQTGAADFLLAAMAWAGKHRGEAVDIVWIGDGILRDMLRAQPLPPNLSQRFISRPSAEEIADVFAQSGILVAPTAFGDAGHPVLQALAAGIPVLGSVHCRSVRQWVRDGETGWVFDPLKPGALNRAMSRALAAGATELDRMGRLARGDAEAATSATMAGRVRYAIGRLREAGDFDFATRRKFG